jgi:hypothetical protein
LGKSPPQQKQHADAPAPWLNRIIGEGEEAPDQLLANPRNWRIHPKAQQDALAGILSEVGWVQRVIVNQRTGHIVDGHLRVALAISRQEPSVPVVYVDLSEEEERMVLASLDPLAAMAIADSEQLDALLAEVSVSDEALRAMLDGLRSEPKAGLTDPDAVPEPLEPISKTGDLWVCGDHRLLCGDSTKAEDIERLMVGEKAGAIVSDPPYGMGLDTDWSGIRGTGQSLGFKKNVKGKAYAPVHGDDSPFDPAPIFTLWAAGVVEVFLFGADYYAERIPSRTEGSWLVWDKRKETQADGFGSEFELIWSQGRHKRRILRHEWFGFLRAGEHGERRTHPTQKPIALIEDIIQQWCGGGIIADPFLGSGTTMIACERLGRRCFGMEIEPRYVDVAVKRWEQFTGKEATRG